MKYIDLRWKNLWTNNRRGMPPSYAWLFWESINLQILVGILDSLLLILECMLKIMISNLKIIQTYYLRCSKGTKYRQFYWKLINYQRLALYFENGPISGQPFWIFKFGYQIWGQGTSNHPYMLLELFFFVFLSELQKLRRSSKLPTPRLRLSSPDFGLGKYLQHGQ